MTTSPTLKFARAKDADGYTVYTSPTGRVKITSLARGEFSIEDSFRFGMYRHPTNGTFYLDPVCDTEYSLASAKSVAEQWETQPRFAPVTRVQAIAEARALWVGPGRPLWIAHALDRLERQAIYLDATTVSEIAALVVTEFKETRDGGGSTLIQDELLTRLAAAVEREQGAAQ